VAPPYGGSSPRSDGPRTWWGPWPAAHLAANEDLPGIFCIDGHVRAYHGRSHLPRPTWPGHAWPLPAPSTPGSRLQGRRGDGLDGGTGRHAQRELARRDRRSLPGRPEAVPRWCSTGRVVPAARPRSSRPGSHILTYRKGKTEPDPGPPSSPTDTSTTWACPIHHLHRTVRLATSRAKPAAASHAPVTRLGPVECLTRPRCSHPRRLAPTEVAQRTFDRWRIENFFR